MEVDEERADGQHDQQHAEPVRREHAEAVEPHQQGRGPDDAGEPDPGVVELEDDPERPGQEQQERDLGAR
jgi:hypothetical protein